ncbi:MULTISPECIES: D-glycero-beta-D-manno-heptose 1,7-bisphosphate 7-phosphatase [Aliivibrio]|uniref:D,D-heptose 1,7-bisphosphate phosphatase n=1 Tax=Aliivibrio finisterrensis TaxID=511998 RepID=A0A4Q5KW74_9GAMM|nr:MULTISPECIES: D-glycero-beta-D-manno-heptose 1,7-bisphosphate 7-phosphatase [Aliivibrio]KAB2825280.1 D-glycero-beta-D-manno-heptose 1,7-bisphosphate 7-phosphatase [Aliivibrio finisterrensis]MDD9178644.1 D-glycero-beta-D-manno-heptose 1,7-bisphosphate 7-phosphatase [Aliivibrio sp. A6]RYU53058.1 D-glycero-beta-D-manno-heptose 1,7-bisphosphate 7-phosphatase [Aliivibrio finisterrensis]RYU55300.1 D-glycero-beta-D-manno-heptose 1,7-bisphosphate 7-phosphatase [Aliivibrio finisterrensis]RYU60087.1 
MSKPAVFIDRDGVINVDRGYVHKRDDFEYIDGVFDAVKKCKDMGYLLVLVTNQSGIARGMFTEEQFEILTEWMDWNFADHGIDFDGIYYCPHHPEATVEKYKEECDCRKPNPGMFNSAQSFLDIDMENSVMIGDKKEDMMAAQAAGVGTRILVRTGKPVTEEGEALATTVLDSIADVPKFLFA